jgi:DNA mismatch endonuclease (patch repair protein)
MLRPFPTLGFAMADIVSEAQRSYIMSRIRSSNTKPELLVRKILHGLGYRFTVNGPKNKKLPGSPDVVLPKYNTVVFVHGCFWHGHESCRTSHIPKSRTEFWEKKIGRNKARDAKNEAEVGELGWNVVVVWECELKNREKLAEFEEGLPLRIGMPK